MDSGDTILNYGIFGSVAFLPTRYPPLAENSTSRPSHRRTTLDSFAWCPPSSLELQGRWAFADLAEKCLKRRLGATARWEEADLWHYGVAAHLSIYPADITTETDRRGHLIRCVVANLASGLADERPHGDLLEMTVYAIRLAWFSEFFRHVCAPECDRAELSPTCQSQADRLSRVKGKALRLAAHSQAARRPNFGPCLEGWTTSRGGDDAGAWG